MPTLITIPPVERPIIFFKVVPELRDGTFNLHRGIVPLGANFNQGDFGSLPLEGQLHLVANVDGDFVITIGLKDL